MSEPIKLYNLVDGSVRTIVSPSTARGMLASGDWVKSPPIPVAPDDKTSEDVALAPLINAMYLKSDPAELASAIESPIVNLTTGEEVDLRPMFQQVIGEAVAELVKEVTPPGKQEWVAEKMEAIDKAVAAKRRGRPKKGA